MRRGCRGESSAELALRVNPYMYYIYIRSAYTEERNTLDTHLPQTSSQSLRIARSLRVRPRRRPRCGVAGVASLVPSWRPRCAAPSPPPPSRREPGAREPARYRSWGRGPRGSLGLTRGAREPPRYRRGGRGARGSLGLTRDRYRRGGRGPRGTRRPRYRRGALWGPQYRRGCLR